MSIENVTPPKDNRRKLHACCVDEIVGDGVGARSAGLAAAERYMVMVWHNFNALCA